MQPNSELPMIAGLPQSQNGYCGIPVHSRLLFTWGKGMFIPYLCIKEQPRNAITPPCTSLRAGVGKKHSCKTSLPFMEALDLE